MSNIKKNKIREHRIDMEIVVDAYDEWERAMGWYYYLENVLKFPFEAKCIAKRIISPLKKGDNIEVAGMPQEDECSREMFVEIKFQNDLLAAPLSQLKPINVKGKIKQAIEDWHYWVKRGYKF